VNIDRIRELQPLFHGEYTVLLTDGTRLTLSRRFKTDCRKDSGAGPDRSGRGRRRGRESRRAEDCGRGAVEGGVGQCQARVELDAVVEGAQPVPCSPSP
jgi:hypothetical protein